MIGIPPARSPHDPLPTGSGQSCIPETLGAPNPCKRARGAGRDGRGIQGSAGRLSLRKTSPIFPLRSLGRSWADYETASVRSGGHDSEPPCPSHPSSHPPSGQQETRNARCPPPSPRPHSRLCSPDSLRWVFDPPDHPAYVARIEWQPRGAAEVAVHPVARRSAPSVTALALACLCRGIALSGEAAALERSGGLATEEHGTWWTIRATNRHSYAGDAGDRPRESRRQNQDAATALKRLKADRDGWRGFGDFWKASG